MKRKFISAFLFGALLLAPASTFVSCSDYDDDIENLQGQITSNATDLASLTNEKLKNLEAEVASLKQQKDDLEAAYKAADEALKQAVKQATNDAEGYAQVQAAQAQEAAIAAAKAEVAAAQAALEAAIDEAKAQIKGNADNIAALMAANATMDTAIKAAQAKAEEAYNLAQQAVAAAGENKTAIEKVAADLAQIKQSLDDQILVIQGQVAELQGLVQANKAALEAQQTVIDELKKLDLSVLDQLAAEDVKLKELINANTARLDAMEETLKGVQSLVDAGVESAKAYTDAQIAAATAGLLEQVQAEVAPIKEDIEGIFTELDGISGTLYRQGNNINSLIGQVAELQEAFGMQTEGIQNALVNLQNAIEGAGGINDQIEEIWTAVGDNLTAITGLNQLINGEAGILEQLGDLSARFASYYTKNEIDTKLTTLATAAEVSGIKTTAEAAKSAADANKTAISDLNNALVAVNASLDILTNSIANLITGIIFQDQDAFKAVYAQVVGNSAGDNYLLKADGVTYDHTQVVFPYNNAPDMQKLTVGKYHVQKNAGEIYVTINPNNIDFEGEQLGLENSLGETSQYFALLKTEVAKGHLIKAAAANGLYKVPVQTKNTLLTDEPDYQSDEAAYAVVATSKCDSVGYVMENGEKVRKVYTYDRKIYSKYEFTGVRPTRIYSPYTNLTLTALQGANGTSVTENAGLFQFSKLNDNNKLILGTGSTYPYNDRRVYKKYIECTQVVKINPDGSRTTLSAADGKNKFNQANAGVFQTALAADDLGGNDTISVVCPDIFKNYEISVRYYIWNYDGSVYSMDKTLVFNQELWGPNSDSFTKVIDGNSTRDYEFAAYKDFAFVKGELSSNNTAWKQEASKVAAVWGNGDAALNGATLELKKADGTLVQSVAIAANDNSKASLPSAVADREAIKRLSVKFNPANLTPDHEYNITLRFYNAVGYPVNTVNLSFTLKVDATQQPNPFRIPAAFAGENTYGWATLGNGTNGAAAGQSFYNLEGSVKVTDPWQDHYFVFKDTDNTYGQTGGTNNVYKPVVHTGIAFPIVNDPTAAGYDNKVVVNNQSVKDEHVYHIKAGLRLFNMAKYDTYSYEGGWYNDFNLIFLSPIKYAINGTTSLGESFTYGGIKVVNQNAMKVLYRQDFTVNDALFKALDPSYAQEVQVHFFESLDSRVADKTKVKVEFADPTDGNNGLFTAITQNADGTWTLKTSQTVAMQGDTPVAFKVTVTDKWGCVSSFNFTVTVLKNL